MHFNRIFLHFNAFLSSRRQDTGSYLNLRQNSSSAFLACVADAG